MHLVVKCTHTGVTVLKNDAKFKKRLGGSQSHELTPHPCLAPKTALNRRGNLGPDHPNDPVPKPPRKRPPGTKADKQLEDNEEKPEREYTVNKKLIPARVYSYLCGQVKPILHHVIISFPPCVDDDRGYQALNTWLTVCRTSLHLRDYTWTAEHQPDTGTIHYHMLVPQYVNIEKYNRAMVVVLSNMVRKGQLKWSVVAASRYNGVHLAKNKATKKVTNYALGKNSKALSAYITKYVTKNNGRFSHFAWHNSRGFSSVMTSVSLTEHEARYLKLRGMLNLDRVYISDFATWIAWKDTPPPFFRNLLGTVNRQLLNRGPTEIIDLNPYLAEFELSPTNQLN